MVRVFVDMGYAFLANVTPMFAAGCALFLFCLFDFIILFFFYRRMEPKGVEDF